MGISGMATMEGIINAKLKRVIAPACPRTYGIIPAEEDQGIEINGIGMSPFIRLRMTMIATEVVRDYFDSHAVFTLIRMIVLGRARGL